MPLEPESDLHWTAFNYVMGDLPLDEASRFELRLADDQDARDAVLEAVELGEALAVVGAEFRSKRRPIGRRTWIASTVLLAAAACLALAVVPSFRSIRPAQADASEVAMAWSSLRGAESGPVRDHDAEVGPENEAEVEPSTDRALPSWLLTAASAPADDSPRQED